MKSTVNGLDTYECMFCNRSSDSYIVKYSTYSEEEKVYGRIHGVE